MIETNYEKYLVRKPVYEACPGVKTRQSPVMTFMSSRQVPEANCFIQLGWIYSIPEPNPHIHEHVHDFDEILLHWGGNHETPQVLGGEIEFYIGGQPISFNTTTAFFIPKGTPHGPVIWKKFRFPHMQMAMMLGSGNAVEAWGETGIGESKKKSPIKNDKFDYEQYAIRSPMREAGAEFVKGRTSPTMTYMSGIQIPGVKCYIEMGWTFDMPESSNPNATMPEMVHSNFDEIVLHIGGEPDSPEDLGGEIEFFVGGQPLTFSTSAALFIPKGLRHGPLSCKEYRKPHLVMAIMLGASTVKEGWEGSFVT